jgi:hypothetical protein
MIYIEGSECPVCHFYNRYPSDLCHWKYICPCNVLEAIFTQVQTCKGSLFHALFGRDTSLSLCCWMFREFVYWFYSCDIYLRHFMSTADFDCVTNWYCVNFNVFMLLVVCVNRYLNICQPLRQQMTLFIKEFLCLLLSFFCNVLLAWFVFAGVRQRKFANFLNFHLHIIISMHSDKIQQFIVQILLQYMLLFTIWKHGCVHFSVHVYRWTK